MFNTICNSLYFCLFGSIVWKEGTPNSPEAAIPLLLLKGKEDGELLESIIPGIEEEKAALSNDGIHVDVCEKRAHFKFDFNLTMVDGKMIKLLTGRGGAFCVLCPASREECHNLQKIHEGFPIGEVTNENLRNLFQDLQQEGQIKTKPGDYSKRLGLTQKPITTSDIKVFPVLHATLRTMDWILKTIYHLAAGVRTWRENFLNEEKIKKAKDKVKSHIYGKTGIRVDEPDPVGKGGTSTTGPISRRLIHERTNRQALIDCIPEKGDDRKQLAQVIQNMSVILRLVSCTEQINPTKLDVLCKDTSRVFLDQFPNFRFSCSVHQVLAHSAELIDANKGHGLGTLSEEALENNNKNIRRYREQLSRKTSQEDNLVDVFHRLWVKSDPVVRSFRHTAKCTYCDGDHNVRSCPKRKTDFTMTTEDELYNSFLQ